MTCASGQSSSPTIQYRKLRAPDNHGTALVDPPGQECRDVLERNQLSRADDVAIGDTTLGQLSSSARKQLVERALTYTRSYRDYDGVVDETRVILSGHQPQLFHPGVWFKNFALHEFAEATGSTPVNIVIDNDICGAPFLKVPTGSHREVRTESIAFDASATPVPFEERRIKDVALFDSFGTRVADSIAPFVSDPLIRELWPLATITRKHSDNLGQCLAQSRHRFESMHGLQTLELPLSEIADSQSFRQFASHVLTHIERFRAIYNAAVLEYRQVHNLRSHSHPVPLLGEVDGWYETPFWAWSSAHPVRKPLFVRPSSDGVLRLRVDDQEFAFDAFEDGAFKLRPRALMTTMYGRVCLSDLFLHGIGGAKYDQVTDVIISQFLGFTAPKYYTLTATMQLPLNRTHVEQDDVRRINGLLRELWYHPEQMVEDCPRFSAKSADFSGLTKEKKRLLSCLPPKGQRKDWHEKLQQINTQIRTLVSSCRKDLLNERERLVTQLRQDTVMSSREYAFCLFPATTLVRTLLDLCCVCS